MIRSPVFASTVPRPSSRLRAFIGRNLISSSARPVPATKDRIAPPPRPAGASRAPAKRPRAARRGLRGTARSAHIELGEVGEVRAAAQRRQHDVGLPFRRVRLARGDDLRTVERERAELAGLDGRERRGVDPVGGHDLEPVDDEHGVDRARIEHHAARRRRARRAGAPRSRPDRTAGASSSGRRRPA